MSQDFAKARKCKGIQKGIRESPQDCQGLGEKNPEHLAFCGSCCLQCFTGTAALEEDAQILKVIEAYCTGAGFQQALSSGGHKQII